MTKGVLGGKIGMTQVFRKNGELIPVTIVEAKEDAVLQKKTVEVDGYNVIQARFEDRKTYKKDAKSNKHANKPAEGRAKRVDAILKCLTRESRNVGVDAYEVGQETSVDAFVAGDVVDVTGVSKGRSFRGAIECHEQSHGPMSHSSHFHRAPGSVGMASGASKVFEDQKIPGHMGGNVVTVQNLEIVQVNIKNKVILIKGNIPGPKKGLVEIRTSIKKGNK